MKVTEFFQGTPKDTLIDGNNYEVVQLIKPFSGDCREIKVLLQYGSFVPKYFSFPKGTLRNPDGSIVQSGIFKALYFKAQETEFLDPDPEKPGEFKKTVGWILHPLPPPKKDS